MSQSNFTIWGQPQCSYCEMSKKLLQLRNLKYDYKEIGSGYSKEDLLKVVPSARGVPQIFVDGIHIGGYKELVGYLSHAKV